jgi:PAS domain S-box-containing protein
MHTTILIDEKKHAEQAAQESEQRYKRLLASVTDYVYSVTIDQGRPLRTVHGPGCEAVTGYTSREFEADPFLWYRMICSEDRPAVMAQAEGILRGQTPPPLEHRIVHKNGRSRWVRNTTVAHKDDRGRLISYDGLISDITHRKQAELALRQSYQTQEVLNALLSISLRDLSLEEALQQVIDQILAVPWLSLEAKGAIFVVEADPFALVLKAQRNLPASCQATCGVVPFGRCLCGRAAASGKTEFAQHLDDHHEIRYDGMTPHGHYSVPIMVTADQVLGVINLYIKENHPQEPKEVEFLQAVANVVGGIIQRKRGEEQLKQALADLTTAHEELKATHEELKATELQLIQAAKLEAVGTLAAGVAHEVKNPLQTILMGLEYLTNNVRGLNDTTTTVLGDMQDAVTRANVIVRELLQFSAAKDFEPKAEDLNCVVERSLWLINNEIMALQINVVRKLGAGLPRVRLDRSKMEQIFLNLFHNALHAMSPGGVLTVTTVHRRFGEDIELSGPAFAQFKPGELVVVAEVQDNGKGIPKDHLAKVFDPFFTTKPAGVGTGLGLSVVKKIMDLHGGSIDIRNSPLAGVVVRLMLRAEPEKTL